MTNVLNLARDMQDDYNDNIGAYNLADRISEHLKGLADYKELSDWDVELARESDHGSLIFCLITDDKDERIIGWSWVTGNEDRTIEDTGGYLLDEGEAPARLFHNIAATLASWAEG